MVEVITTKFGVYFYAPLCSLVDANWCINWHFTYTTEMNFFSVPIQWTNDNEEEQNIESGRPT